MGLKSSIISREVCTTTTLEEGSGDGGDDNSHRATSLEDVPQSPGMHLFYSFMTDRLPENSEVQNSFAMFFNFLLKSIELPIFLSNILSFILFDYISENCIEA